jgi:hypothetical protein
MSELWMMKFIWQCNFKEEGDMITDYIEAALAPDFLHFQGN